MEEMFTKVSTEELAEKNPEQVVKKLPAGVTMPTANYLELSDYAFQDRAKVESVRMSYEYMAQALSSEFQEMRELGDFVIGNQWSAADAQYLEKLGRIPRAFNLILPQIVAFEGTTMGTRTKLKLYPRGEEDTTKATIHTDILNYSLDEAKYWTNRKRVQSDALIFRRGFMAITWEYTGRYPDGQLATRRTNPFDNLFDTESNDVDINRGRCHVYTRFMDSDRIIQLYVNDNATLADYLDRRARLMEGPTAKERRRRSGATRFREYSGAPTAFTIDKKTNKGGSDQLFSESGRPSTDYFDAVRGFYRVIEYAERRMADKKFLFDFRTDQQYPLTDEESKRPGFIRYLLDTLELDESAIRTRVLPEYWVIVVAPGLSDEVVLMEMPYSVQDPVEDYGIAHKITVCYDQHPDKAKHIGMVDLLKDPQEATNRRWSTKDDTISMFMNPRVVGWQPAFGKYYNDWLQGANKAGSILRVDGRPGQYPIPQFEYPPASLPQLLDQDMDLLMNFMEQSTGVNQNLRGFQQSAGESGAAFEYRAQRGETMLAPIVDNAHNSMKEEGRYAHATLTTHMTEQRSMRIMGDELKMRWIQVNQKDGTGKKIFDMRDGFSKFDFEIDETSYTPTQRERYYAEWRAWINTLPPDALLRVMILTKVLPLSSDSRKYEVIDELKKWLVLTQGPQILMPLEEIVSAMQVPQPTADGGMQAAPQPNLGVEQGMMPQGIGPGPGGQNPPPGVNIPQSIR